MAGEFLDLSSDPESSAPAPTGSSNDAKASRRFLGVQFACCSVYSRIYVNKDQTAYVGNCPKCMHRVEMKIGEGGSDSRFFTVY
jgi:hypothetical protein